MSEIVNPLPDGKTYIKYPIFSNNCTLCDASPVRAFIDLAGLSRKCTVCNHIFRPIVSRYVVQEKTVQYIYATNKNRWPKTAT